MIRSFKLASFLASLFSASAPNTACVSSSFPTCCSFSLASSRKLFDPADLLSSLRPTHGAVTVHVRSENSDQGGDCSLFNLIFPNVQITWGGSKTGRNSRKVADRQLSLVLCPVFVICVLCVLFLQIFAQCQVHLMP